MIWLGSGVMCGMVRSGVMCGMVRVDGWRAGR